MVTGYINNYSVAMIIRANVNLHYPANLTIDPAVVPTSE